MKLLEPTGAQSSELVRVILDSYRVRRGLTSVDVAHRLAKKIRLAVPDDFDDSTPSDLRHAPPRLVTSDLSQMVEIGESLAGALAKFINSYTGNVLLVPMALSVPSEVPLLQQRLGTEIVIEGDEVVAKFTGTGTSSEIIRRSLARMLGLHSVAWIVTQTESSHTPLAALVSVFDGEGWAVVGEHERLVGPPTI